MRGFLESVGEVCKKPEVGGVMGLIFGLATLAVNAGSQGLTLALIGFCIAIAVVGVIVVVGFGHLITFVSEQIHPDIIIDDTNDPRNEWPKNGNFINLATLKVTNKEKTEITNCYVLLKRVIVNGSLDLSNHLVDPKSNRLTWSDGNCEASISGWRGEAVLCVYEIEIPLNKVAAVNRSDFCICDPKRGINLMPRGIYKLTCELHGKFSGKEIRPISFTRFLYVAISQTENETSTTLIISNRNQWSANDKR